MSNKIIKNINKEISKVNEINKKQKEEIINLQKISSQKETNLKQTLYKEKKELLEKQKKEIEHLINNYEIKIKPIISSIYLQLKTREYYLCKQERFIEAEEAKEKAQKQYLEDNKHIENEKKLRLYQKIEELNNKHRLEYIKFIKDKDKKIYYVKKEEDNEKQIINEKYNREKKDEILKKNITHFTELKNKKKKDNKIDNNSFKRNKNNPWN